MSERLQNIINGINDGSIKFVFDYNLTMEDLFDTIRTKRKIKD